VISDALAALMRAAGLVPTAAWPAAGPGFVGADARVPEIMVCELCRAPLGSVYAQTQDRQIVCLLCAGRTYRP
jgi:hypothetical protein